MINFLGLVFASILLYLAASFTFTRLILPALNAASLTRYSIAMHRAYPDLPKINYFCFFFNSFVVFIKLSGRLTFKGPQGYWRGIGDWKVYQNK